MLDLKFIRENSKVVKERLAFKGEKKADIDSIIKLDETRREIIRKVEQWKAERNSCSEQVAMLKKEKKNADEIIAKTRELSQQIKNTDKELIEIENKIKTQLDWLPNLPHTSVPKGKNEADNVVVHAWGKIPEYDFPIENHIEIGERLGLFDLKRGSKISGSGFPLYTNLGARLERSIINFMLDLHTTEHGYTEIFPPFIVNPESLYGTGNLPKFGEDLYFMERDNQYLIPTAEVPVTNIHRDEMLNVEDLPVKYAAYSACFRREAGSWGKDTRGLLRLHQFNKVELVKLVKPEESYDEHEKLLNNAKKVLELLNLPYRVISLCGGDLSFSAAKCYDIELWSPAEKTWLEVSSCSNFEDFQARRANIRFRREAKSKPEFVHTLNASGVATPRLMVAILENYQTDEGSVIVPEPLRKYFGSSIIKKSF